MTGKPGYVKMISQTKDVQEKNQLIRTAVKKNKLSPDKVANKFYAELKKCKQQCQQEARKVKGGREINDNEEDAAWKLEQLRHIDDRITLRRHGPAVQLDVMDPTATNKIYSVDMVPTIEISGKYYIAKPIKKRKPNGQLAWRQSFSLMEKERLATIDVNNGCRKQVLRVLKAIRNRDHGGVGQLSSYHFKTALFRKTDELRDPAQWRSECLGERLMDVISQLEKELGKAVMPHYFLPAVNLLDGMKEQAILNVRNRLKHLKNSEQKMTRLLQS